MEARGAFPRSVLAGIVFLMSLTSVSAITNADLQEKLSLADYRATFSNSDFQATMKMVSTDPTFSEPKVREYTQFRRDGNDAMVMVTLLPEVDKGQGKLRIDENMWTYDPESRKFTHTTLKENIEGTDVKNNDIKRPTIATDYKVVGFKEGKLGAYDVYIIDLKAVNEEVPYATQKAYMRKDNFVLLMVQSFSLTNRLLRTTYYPTYSKIGDKYIATTTIFKDELVAGKQTTLTMSNISLAPIPDSVFSKAYIEKINK
ncbi:MAG: outer membrane lipoprotein-sorting protein [Spirochaetota bacterium]